MQRGKNNLRDRVRAFTLVEMLVTLTIGSLLVVSVVSTTRALARTSTPPDDDHLIMVMVTPGIPALRGSTTWI